MGRQLKRYPDGTFNVWCTITDSYLYEEPVTKQQLILDRMQDHMLEAQLKTIEDLMTFPANMVDEDTGRISPKAKVPYLEWHLEVLKSDDYDKLVNEKLGQLLAELRKEKP